MTPAQICQVREGLQLTQLDFARLLGVHPITVSKWERGVLDPTPYQLALITSFAKAKSKPGVPKGAVLVGVMVGAGISAALFLLLQAAMSGPKPKRKLAK